jgi:hypothetical protein
MRRWSGGHDAPGRPRRDKSRPVEFDRRRVGALTSFNIGNSVDMAPALRELIIFTIRASGIGAG